MKCTAKEKEFVIVKNNRHQVTFTGCWLTEEFRLFTDEEFVWSPPFDFFATRPNELPNEVGHITDSSLSTIGVPS